MPTPLLGARYPLAPTVCLCSIPAKTGNDHPGMEYMLYPIELSSKPGD